MEIIIDHRKSVQQNAADYFEKAKKSKKKLDGAIKALEKTRELIKKNKEQNNQNKQIIRKISNKKEWYEKFRWFFSSDNFLIIGGRDSTTNEIIIKKYTSKNDLVFHTEIAGSPFVVIKNPENINIPDSTLKEAAEFCASFSKYWQRNLSVCDVYCVKPEQVSKEVKTGQYLAKGSFMIYGERKYYKVSVGLAMGVYSILGDHKLMIGPLSAIKKNCKKYVILVQSNKKSSDTAKQLKNFFIELNLGVDEILQLLPSGIDIIINKKEIKNN
ncbi:MAG: NFACT RNA binding domain-containing protein [Candidatus Woesearchaeota archaeon]